jgi:alpha-tubulin suppressor-like RCC1 family protein
MIGAAHLMMRQGSTGPAIGNFWGWGYAGAVGLPFPLYAPPYYYSSPAQIGSLRTWKDFSLGSAHSAFGGGIANSWGLAIRTDGTLWAWGENPSGECGLGDSSMHSSPVQVGADTDWAMVSCGGPHLGSVPLDSNTLAIKTNGTLWAIGGQNIYGSLFSDRLARSSPSQVGSDTDWKSVNVGICVLAIKTNGTLWARGYNNVGQLGQGDRINRSEFVQVGSDTNWTMAVSGYMQSVNGAVLAVKTNGTLWAWGGNNFGGLGLGDTTPRSSPCQVGSGIDWKYVASGYLSLAIKTNGTLWSWGQNNLYGCLGLGDITTNRSSPVQIGGGTDWKVVRVSSSVGMSAAIKNDGTLWSWGYNAEGGLGLGDITHRSSPCQIGSGTNWTSLGQPSTAYRCVAALQTP